MSLMFLVPSKRCIGLQMQVCSAYFWISSFLSGDLTAYAALNLAPLKLHPDSLVFLGGGWKGNADRAISKPELYQLHTTCSEYLMHDYAMVLAV